MEQINKKLTELGLSDFDVKAVSLMFDDLIERIKISMQNDLFPYLEIENMSEKLGFSDIKEGLDLIDFERAQSKQLLDRGFRDILD